MREAFYKNPNPLENTTVVFGHVPTKEIRTRTESSCANTSIWHDVKHNNDKIGIDCGCCFAGGKPACLRLDDMREYYVDNHTAFYETEEEIMEALKSV